MNGKDFVDLAVKLGNGATEAEYRTSVSRSYYGAFHEALELLAEMGVKLPGGPEAHQKLRYCLLQCGEPAGMEAGEKLQSLRNERNTADYNLTNRRGSVRQNAVFQTRVASEILDALGQCRQEPAKSRFRTKVRAYVAQTLRLPLPE